MIAFGSFNPFNFIRTQTGEILSIWGEPDRVLPQCCMVRTYVRKFGPELLSFDKIAPALATGLRHVFLGNIFWYAKENTAIFLPNSLFYSLDCKFVYIYIYIL